jgi:hypothetical protein
MSCSRLLPNDHHDLVVKVLFRERDRQRTFQRCVACRIGDDSGPTSLRDRRSMEPFFLDGERVSPVIRPSRWDSN